MTGVILGFIILVLTLVGAGVTKAMRDLIAEEIRGWVEFLPGAILQMAAMHLDSSQRISIYRDEWLPELLFITRRAEGRPITKFIEGTKFALGLLRAGRHVGRELRRAQRNELAAAAPVNVEIRFGDHGAGADFLLIARTGVVTVGQIKQFVVPHHGSSLQTPGCNNGDE